MVFYNNIEKIMENVESFLKQNVIYIDIHLNKLNVLKILIRTQHYE